jgi:SPFH domain / Band 7 family
LEEDQTRAIKPDAGPANPANPGGWNFDADLDDAMLSDQDAEQVFAQLDQQSGNASQDDDSAFMTVWRQLSPILVPVPFAIIIFLFSLLFNARGISNIAPLPLGIILLIVVVIQGTCLFYAGNYTTPWTLSIAGGYVLFLLVFAYVIAGLTGSLVLLAAVLILGIFLGGRAVRQVPEGCVDIVLKFGRYSRTLTPGFNLLFPWERVDSRQSTKEITWTCPPVRVTMTRDQDVEVVASVTYQLLEDDAHIAVLNMANWEEDVHQHFMGIINSVVHELSTTDFIAWVQHVHSRPQVAEELANPTVETHWDRLNATLLRRLQDQLANRGILVSMVHTQDISLSSPHFASAIGEPGALRAVDAGITRGQQPVTPQWSQMQVPAGGVPQFTARQAEIAAQPTGQPPQAAPGTAPAPQGTAAPMPEAAKSSAFSPIMMQGMIDAYESVNKQQMNDPAFILNLAERFQAIASNPEADKQFPYDALKAANSLYRRANEILASEERKRASIQNSPAPASPPAPAQVERQVRRLSNLPNANENLAGGGQ